MGQEQFKMWRNSPCLKKCMLWERKGCILLTNVGTWPCKTHGTCLSQVNAMVTKNKTKQNSGSQWLSSSRFLSSLPTTSLSHPLSSFLPLSLSLSLSLSSFSTNTYEAPTMGQVSCQVLGIQR